MVFEQAGAMEKIQNQLNSIPLPKGYMSVAPKSQTDSQTELKKMLGL